MGEGAGTEAAGEAAKTAAQTEMLANRLHKRRRHLRKWARRTGTGMYRLYDRDIPEIPLVLDWYEDAVSGALYERPYEKDETAERRWLSAMTDAVSAALEIPRDRIFLKERRRQRGKAQYGPLDRRHFFRDVQEGDLNFRVNLSDYLDTGLFPDRRLLRAQIRQEAREKRVLNLFAYTCSFSVYAAAGGAASVDSVDLSRAYLDWGMLNFELNGFKGAEAAPRDLSAGYFVPDHAAGSARGASCGRVAAAKKTGILPPFRFIRADILRFLPGAKQAALRWDLIILDPPAFSNSKKMRGVLDIRRDYRELVSLCLDLLAPGGNLFISVNARSFKLEGDAFPGMEITDLTESLRDEDFRGKRIPACWVMHKS
ncbi:MAG: class I SAM-dependent methyltransferase [Treponema sp.]|jgi:23S rRNA G2069 N7-methylase RlmK/C1962 C5-methylase RlmI|nr:class I SAM-dependent methyltransferase [Treponema sp.]